MNEMNQITMQIEELVNKRKALEQKWQKLEAKEQQLLETSKFYILSMCKMT